MVTLPRQQLSSCGSDVAEKADDNKADSRKQLVVYLDFLSSGSTWQSRAVFIYFVLYIFVGVAAFVNFLPWT